MPWPTAVFTASTISVARFTLCCRRSNSPSRMPGHAISSWNGRDSALSRPRMPRMKTIAIDLDDTLNNFEETLQTTPFLHGGEYGFSEAAFADYLERVRRRADEDNELLSTEYSFFKYRIHHRCYELAAARADGVAFVRE